MTKPLRINGRMTSRYQCLEATSYVNLRTGEVIPAEQGEQHSLTIIGAVSRKAMAREQVLLAMRPEARAFARFCLEFRNKRRGVTPGFDKLCHLYAALHEKRPQDVRRYLPALEKAGIRAGESVLGVDWQIGGSKVSAAEHLKEDRQAEATYARMCRERSMPITAMAHRLIIEVGGLPAVDPEWMQHVHAARRVAAQFGGEPVTKHERSKPTTEALLRALAFLMDPPRYVMRHELTTH
ncbi:hypothetical protein [Paraburkholderia caledonica]|uniref:Uncharacterized protein n=1 Tax=Paraburkholderia caledonica TaxID=134536 RepID=A0AB73I8F7_9BURK|nr:hypothetical protein [Paraburkholderia caledonica]